MPNQDKPRAARKPRLRVVPAPPARPCPPVAEVVDEPQTPFAADLDRVAHVWVGRRTQGISPPALAGAVADWMAHLALSPGKQLELVEKAGRKLDRFMRFALRSTREDAQHCIEPLPQDYRFRAPEWQRFPFNLIQQGFLLQQQWWHNATTGVRGVSKSHESVVNFTVRQLLDMVSPANFPLTNPIVLDQTINQRGMNLVHGVQNWWQDLQRLLGGEGPVGSEAFRVGENLATTPGAVVMRNQLVELIQYAPATGSVHAEPVLIVPAWIMKYYILDLSETNSLIRHLVERGHTVFCLSWRNPREPERDLGMEDYLRLGFRAALDAVNAIVPGQRVHAVGYCLGGTLLAIGAAAMARDGDERLASMTLFAAQTDFSEPGELGLFINESQVTFLEDLMWEKGYLDTQQMAGAFYLLRSSDLVWSRMVSDYLMGERPELNDMMAWNADATRMPFRMHSEYLRWLYLEDRLANGHLEVDGRPVMLKDLGLPVYLVGTERDHVAPWRSVYKLLQLADGEIRFVLASGGHNFGIIAEPGRPRSHYRELLRPTGGRYLSPDDYLRRADQRQGSWWESWFGWLEQRGGPRVAPPALGTPGGDYAPIMEAPGRYVHQR